MFLAPRLYNYIASLIVIIYVAFIKAHDFQIQIDLQQSAQTNSIHKNIILWKWRVQRKYTKHPQIKWIYKYKQNSLNKFDEQFVLTIYVQTANYETSRQQFRDKKKNTVAKEQHGGDFAANQFNI